MHRRLLLPLVAAFIMLGLVLPASAQQGKPVKVALIADKTGPLEAYAKQTVAGFIMGLEYATGGTMTVDGHKLDGHREGQPDQARCRPQPALPRRISDDNVDLAVGGTSSGVALAMLPVAQDQEGADRRAGGRQFDHRRQMEPLHLPHRPQLDAGRVSNALAIGKPDVVVGDARAGLCLRPRRRHRLQRGAGRAPAPSSCSRNTRRQATTDFTAPPQRIFDALARSRPAKILWSIWAGGNPFPAIKALNPERLGIEVATGGNILPALAAYKDFPGSRAPPTTTMSIPKNPAE